MWGLMQIADRLQVWLDYFFKTGRNAFANTEHFQTAGR